MTDKNWRPNTNKLNDEELTAHIPPNSSDDKRSITGETGTEPTRNYNRHFNLPTPEETPNVPRDLNTLGNQIDTDITDLNSRTHTTANRVDTNTDNIRTTADIVQSHRNEEGVDQMGGSGNPEHEVNAARTTQALKKHPHSHDGRYATPGHKHPASGDGTFPGYSENGHTHDYAPPHGHPYIDTTASHQTKAGPLTAMRFYTEAGGLQGNIEMNSGDGNPPGLFLKISGSMKVYFNAANSSTETASRGPAAVLVPHRAKKHTRGISLSELEAERKAPKSFNMSEIDLHKIKTLNNDLDPESLREAGFDVNVSAIPPYPDEEGVAGESPGDEIAFALEDVITFLVHKVQEQDKEIQQLKSQVK